MPAELTEAQLERQDWVDNAVLGLLSELTGQEVEWDMEHIGEIRLVIQEIVVDKLKLMTEMEFYPFIELERQPGAAPALKVCEHEHERKVALVTRLVEKGAMI